MAVFPAIYRARAMQVNGAGLQAYVPQVFGETPIPITAYMGEAPTAAGMGWVMFQGGNPEFPVWCGVSAGGDGEGGPGVFVTRDYRWSNLTAASDPGHGWVRVNNLDPALATEVYLSLYDRDDSGYITATTLQPGDLLAVYLSGDINTRIEYALSGPLVNNGGQWATFPVTVTNNEGFRSGVPGNNVNVKVTVQVTGKMPPTQPMPGGTAGDIIIKNSGTAGDSSWTKTVPALTITTLTAPTANVTTLNVATLNPTSTVALSTVATPGTALQLGVITGPNMVFDRNSIQARDNGAAAALSIQEFGGVLNLGTPAIVVNSGLITFPAAQEHIRMLAAGYQTWYSGASRIGYLQGNATQIYLNAELAGASLRLRGAAGCYLDNGVNNYQVSESVLGPRIVATGASGYIFGNYFNCTANDVASWPDRYAGQAGGDNYLRWYQNVHSSHIRGGDLTIGGTLNAGTNITTAGAVYQSGWFRCNSDNGVYWEQRGRGLYMTDTSYVRVYNGGGIAASTSGDIHAAYFQKSDYAQTGYIDWGRTQLLVSNEGGYGGNAWAGISYWAAGANVAPQITCLGNGGERMGVLNGPGNAYAPIAASAFPVISSLRFKTDVRDLGDDELIGHVRKVRGIHFLPKVRPQNVRPNDRFNKANKRWQEHGHSPLRVTPQHTVMGDHDCDLDPCPGTRDDPCHIALSDTHKFGLSAEALYEVLPELVELDQDRKPEMINVDQIAALALAAVGALARRIEALEAPATKTPAKKTVAKKTTPVKKAQ